RKDERGRLIEGDAGKRRGAKAGGGLHRPAETGAATAADNRERRLLGARLGEERGKFGHIGRAVRAVHARSLRRRGAAATAGRPAGTPCSGSTAIAGRRRFSAASAGRDRRARTARA